MGANGPRRAGPTAGRPQGGQTSKAHRRRARRAPRARPRTPQTSNRAATQLGGLGALGPTALTRRPGAASVSNQLLVALACPDATFVAGFKAWLRLGYCVRKGEKAIRIIAPLPVKERDRATGEESGETITLFKTVFVFDAQQVEPLASGEPTPLEPPSRPLTGDSHADLIEPAVAFAESLGYSVSFEPIVGSAGGWCDTNRKQIVVDSGAALNAQLRTLTHEVIHALGVDYEQYSRAQAEVIVDTTTLVVLGGLGLDVSGETIPYVAGWGEDGAVEAVSEFAQLIDTLARRVDAALTTPDAAPEAGRAA